MPGKTVHKDDNEGDRIDGRGRLGGKNRGGRNEWH